MQQTQQIRLASTWRDVCNIGTRRYRSGSHRGCSEPVKDGRHEFKWALYPGRFSMKLRLMLCTVLLALVAMPAFADTISFTNKGGLSIGSGSISATSVINSLSVDGQLILTGPVGSLNFDTGTITGGSFSGGVFAFSLENSAFIMVNNFAGTISKIGHDLYDLVGTFSGIDHGIAFTGTTNQVFSLSRDDDGR